MINWAVVWAWVNGGAIGMGIGTFVAVCWLTRRVVRIEVMLGIGDDRR